MEWISLWRGLRFRRCARQHVDQSSVVVGRQLRGRRFRQRGGLCERTQSEYVAVREQPELVGDRQQFWLVRLGHGATVQPVIAGFASASSMDTNAAAATYRFASVLLGVAYNRTSFHGLGSVASLNPLDYSGTVSFDNLEGNVRIWVTPAFRLGLSYDYTRRSSVGTSSGAHYQQLNLGADYNLSKATDIYLLTAMQKASGTDSLGQVAVASIAGLTPSATAYQMIVAVGVRHLF